MNDKEAEEEIFLSWSKIVSNIVIPFSSLALCKKKEKGQISKKDLRNILLQEIS